MVVRPCFLCILEKITLQVQNPKMIGDIARKGNEYEELSERTLV